MISPINFSLPTRTMSYIRAPASPRAITAGPEIRVMTPLVPAMPHPLPSLWLVPPLSQLHGEPDVLLYQPGDVGLTALEMGAGRRQRHDDREIAPPQEPRPGLIRAFQQILVDDQQPVSGRGVITDQPKRLLGRRRLANFHAGQAKPGGGLGVGDDRDLIQRRSPAGPRHRRGPAASRGR